MSHANGIILGDTLKNSISRPVRTYRNCLRNEIEHLILENVTEHDIVETRDIKEQVHLLKNENNKLRMGIESLLKVTELLSVQQINTREINDSTEKFITVKETDKSKKNNLHHQQDYRIPLLSNTFETHRRMPGQT